MRLSVKALAFSAALLWAGALLCAGIINLAVPSYGLACLKLMSSVYPGFHASRTLGDVLVGTLYALVDGAIAGLVLGWLYNLFVGRSSPS